MVFQLDLLCVCVWVSQLYFAIIEIFIVSGQILFLPWQRMDFGLRRCSGIILSSIHGSSVFHHCVVVLFNF